MSRFRVWRIRRRGLQRFLDAQNAPAYMFRDGTTMYELAMLELQMGKKVTHWMWFVFPQSPGLGSSERSRIFALTDEEARAYFLHPILGRRLVDALGLVRERVMAGSMLEDIFGEVDAAKFWSCALLFQRIGREVVARQEGLR